jgi:hypothetical protein
MATPAEQIAALERRVRDLEAIHARLRADPEWLALTSCDFAPFTYECCRDWCVKELIDAHKDGGRWFVWNHADRPEHPPSLKTYLARKGVQSGVLRGA